MNLASKIDEVKNKREDLKKHGKVEESLKSSSRVLHKYESAGNDDVQEA